MFMEIKIYSLLKMMLTFFICGLINLLVLRVAITEKLKSLTHSRRKKIFSEFKTASSTEYILYDF